MTNKLTVYMFIKQYNEQEFPIIIDKKDKKVTMDKVIKLDYKDCDNYKSTNSIYLKFELTDNCSNTICLKKYLIKYKDCPKKNNNTLENILIFNEIKIDDNAKYFLKIKKIDGKNREEILLDYDEVKENNIDEIID